MADSSRSIPTNMAEIAIEANSNSSLSHFEDIPADNVLHYIFLLLLLILLFGTAGNLIVITCVVFIRKLRKPCNYLFASLAVADLLVCVVLMPIDLANLVLYGAHNGKWSFSYTSCKFFICVEFLLTTATIGHLTLISLDRFLAIKRPKWYARYRNVRMTFKAVAVLWFVSVVYSFIVIFLPVGEKRDKGDGLLCVPEKNGFLYVTVPVLVFFIPCIMLMLMYSFAYRAYRNLMTSEGQNYQPKNQTVEKGNNTVETFLSKTTQGKLYDASAEEKIEVSETNLSPKLKDLRLAMKSSPTVMRQRRASRILAAIITAFICCWLPLFSFIVVHGVAVGLGYTYPINPIVNYVLHWCGWSNSILNPLLYASLKGDFQYAFKNIFRSRNTNKLCL